MTVRRPVSAALIAMLLAGCTSTVDDPTANGSGSRGAAPVSIDSIPLLRIGKAEGSEADILDRIVTPFLMTDGKLVVPLSGDQAVRIYSATGELEQILGHRGEGPGEFMGIESAWAVGDTIEVWDPRLQRMTRFLNGALLEVMRINTSGGSVPGRFGSGWVFTSLTNSEPGNTTRPPGAVKSDTVGFYLIRPDGSLPQELARIPGLTRYVTSTQRTQPEPLSPEARSAFFDGLLLVGQTLESAVQGVDSLGAARLELRWDLPPMSEPEDAQRAVLETWEVRGRLSVSSLDFTGAPLPERISRFWDFLVDAEGFLWVLVYDPLKHAHALGGWRGPGPGGRWIVFDRSGTPVAEFDLPPRLYPSQILEDKIVGIERDELGVESVAIYRLMRM